MRANGFIVFVPKYGIEGPVYLTEKGADAEAAWTMDEAKQTVTSTDGATRCGSLRIPPGSLHLGGKSSFAGVCLFRGRAKQSVFFTTPPPAPHGANRCGF